MKKVTTLFILLLLVVGLFQFKLQNKNYEGGMNINRAYDLDNNGQEETILFHSPSVDLSDGTTSIYINGQKEPELILRGYFRDSKVFDIKKGLRVLEVEVITGKSVNSIIYRYESGKLVRVPVSTEKVSHFMGIVTRNIPEFKDIDGNGILEMLTYYRHFPPEKKRTVESYIFNGEQFEKQKQYEEETSEVYF